MDVFCESKQRACRCPYPQGRTALSVAETWICPEDLFCPAGVAADGLKGLLADVVLHLAGVGLGGFRVHTQMDQKLRQGLVPVSMLAAMAMPVSVRVMSPSLSMVI